MICSGRSTNNPLFLRIVIDELCVYGSYRGLENEIANLTQCKCVRELFSKYIDRLQNDFKVTTRDKNIVQDVFCALVFCSVGLSEEDLIEMFNLELNQWSPLYFAIERYMNTRHGKLSFAYDELQAEITEKYASSEIDKTKILIHMANFFEKQYKECKRNHQPLPKTAVAELARLLMLGNQHMRLKQLLSDIDIFLYFYRNNIYDTVEKIRYLKQDSFLIAKRFMNAIDCYAVDLYAEVFEELKDDHKKIVKKVVNALMSLGSLLNYCKYFNAERLVLKRLLRILVNNTECTDDKLLSYQAWTQYKIACSHADVEECNVAIAIHAQIIRIRETLRANKSSEYVVEELGMSYHGIALAYAGDEQYEKAIEWYRKSIDIHSKREDISKSYNNIGTILIQLKRYDDAMTELEIAMELEKEYYFGVLPPNVSYTMHNMGLCYRKKNSRQINSFDFHQSHTSIFHVFK